MPLWMILILSGGFGMLGLLGFIGQFRASRAERFLTLGALTPSLPVRPNAPVPVKPAPAKPTLSRSQNPSTENPKPPAVRALSTEPPSPNLGSGSGAPPYVERSHQPPLTWTEYKEDYFCDLIWRWRYRPEMGNQKPRDITAWCPECEAEADPMEYVVRQNTGNLLAVFACSQCAPQRRYSVSGFITDPYDGIRTLIATKLQNGEWEKVVKRQNDVRRGRV